MTTTNYGIPTESELENLANALFPDFDPQRCAKGIEGLATSGDTSVINDAYARAQSYAGGTNYISSAEQAAGGYAGISEYAQIANEYNGGVSEYEQFGGVSEYEGIAQQYTFGDVYTAPQEQPVSGGYSPVVLSHGQADSYVPKKEEAKVAEAPQAKSTAVS